MAFANTLVSILVTGTTLTVLALLVRLSLNGQRRNYPWFFAYLSVLCVESILLQADRSLAIQMRQGISIFSRLVVTVIEFQLIFAIFANWTVSFPGIGAFGRKLLVFIFLIAAALAVSTIPIGVDSGYLIAGIRLTTIASRASNIGFSLFLLLTLGFFRKFGGVVAPNLMRITVGMAAYVTSNSASYFLATNSPQMWLVNSILPAVTIATVVYWFLSIDRPGEIQPATIFAADPAQLEQAENMNRQMQRLSDSVTLIPKRTKRD